MTKKMRIRMRIAALVAAMMICIIAVVALLSGVINSLTSVRFDERKEGCIATVDCESLNLREEAPDGKIITVLYNGDQLYLTGNVQEPSIGSEKPDIWVEVANDSDLRETIGWVYLSGLKVQW